MDDDESGWVFDSLVCFLNGPVWNAPLESFIEEKSLIFEPNVTDNPDYRKIFNDFKNLVDFMLGNFMEDIGITPQQFEDACAKGTQGGICLQFDQTIFEQIWAANDYEMFKRMMIQRNVELQLQALELIEQKYGITPDLFMPDREEAHQSNEAKMEKNRVTSSMLEKEIMKEVVKQLPTYEAKSESASLGRQDAKYLLEEKHNLEEKLKKSIESKDVAKMKNNVEDAKLEAVKIKADIEEKIQLVKKVMQKDENTALKISTADVSQEQSTPTEVDSQEIKKRQEYLRAQRDKLVAMKKEARKKQLQVEEVVVEKSKVRPRSAQKAAESILAGNDASIVKPQQLLIRKALAEKLKSEVIGNKGD